MSLYMNVLLLTLLPSVVVSAPTEKRSQLLLSKFSSLVVFGDSYTDDGVYNYTPPVAAQVLDFHQTTHFFIIVIHTKF